MSPYVLAFTADTVEIRVASNGSLIQIITVPNPHLLFEHFHSSCVTCCSLSLLPSSLSHHSPPYLWSLSSQGDLSPPPSCCSSQISKYIDTNDFSHLLISMRSLVSPISIESPYDWSEYQSQSLDWGVKTAAINEDGTQRTFLYQTALSCLGEGWGQYQEEAGITAFQNILHSHSKIHSPQSRNGSSNGDADTASLLSLDSRLGQSPVICASPDSGVSTMTLTLCCQLHMAIQ